MDHKTVEQYILSMPNAQLDYPFGKEAAVYKAFVPKNRPPLATHLDGVQGAGEQRTELYKDGTAKEQSQPATQQSAKSASGATSLAGGQAGALRGEWKMFAIIQEGTDPLRLSLKCDPNLAEKLRTKYESVMPGYHLNKKHWNTIVLTGQLGWDEIKDQIKHSYDLVAKKE